jgi:hypothetical protein
MIQTDQRLILSQHLYQLVQCMQRYLNQIRLRLLELMQHRMLQQ